MAKSENKNEVQLKKETSKIIQIIKDLAGVYSLPQIGIILRDIHGIGDIQKACGVSLSKIITYQMPHEFKKLLATWVRTHQHIDSNNRDRHAKVRLHNMMSQIKSHIIKASKKSSKYKNFKYTYAYIKKYLYRSKNIYKINNPDC